MAKEPIVLTDQIKPTPALVRAGMEALPAAVLAHGERTSRRLIEFFTASIRNRNTRTSYARAVKQFFDWCDAHAWFSMLHSISLFLVIARLSHRPISFKNSEGARRVPPS
jgi:hypothetical protein